MPKKLRHFRFEIEHRTYIFDIDRNTEFSHLYYALSIRLVETYPEFTSVEMSIDQQAEKSSLVMTLATKMFEQL